MKIKLLLLACERAEVKAFSVEESYNSSFNYVTELKIKFLSLMRAENKAFIVQEG